MLTHLCVKDSLEIFDRIYGNFDYKFEIQNDFTKYLKEFFVTF